MWEKVFHCLLGFSGLWKIGVEEGHLVFRQLQQMLGKLSLQEKVNFLLKKFNSAWHGCST
jgi:hypothetical protein